MKIGYFFTGVESHGKLGLETTVVVRPLQTLPGIEAGITIKLPAPSTDASLNEIAAAALAQAQQLVPESAFAQWAAAHAQAAAAAPATPSHTVPADASQVLDDARYSFS